MAPAPPKLVAVLLAVTAFSLAVSQAQVPPPPPPPLVPSTPPPPAAMAPAPSGGNGSTCNPLKLSVCSNLVSGLLGRLLPGTAGNSSQCCPLLGGFVGLDAAVCLCTALRANVFPIANLDVPLGLRLLLNDCGRAVPAGFTCAPA